MLSRCGGHAAAPTGRFPALCHLGTSQVQRRRAGTTTLRKVRYQVAATCHLAGPVMGCMNAASTHNCRTRCENRPTYLCKIKDFCYPCDPSSALQKAEAMTAIRPPPMRLPGVTRPDPGRPETRVKKSGRTCGSAAMFVLALILAAIGAFLNAPALFVLAGFAGFASLVCLLPGPRAEDQKTWPQSRSLFDRDFEPGTVEYRNRMERNGWL